eukprot:9875294-Lingulodinium_polyedra.AAC.1
MLGPTVPRRIHGGNVGFATTKATPSWNPSVEHMHSFMNWASDISLWLLITDLPVPNQADAFAL